MTTDALIAGRRIGLELMKRRCQAERCCPFWSHNPVDVLGDAPPDRLPRPWDRAGEDVDAVLLIHSQAMTDFCGHARGAPRPGPRTSRCCSLMGGQW
jgi:hypothetical protein